MFSTRNILVSAVLAVLSLGATGAEDQVTSDGIIRAVVELGDSSFSVRERATKYLWSAGKAAEPALQAAAKSNYPEISERAREILADFKYGIYPHTPEEVARIVRSYRHGELDRHQVVTALTQPQLGRKGLPALARLCVAEGSNAEIRAQIF